MASNYNLVARPPVISVRGGVDRVVLRRETESDLFALDPVLVGRSIRLTEPPPWRAAGTVCAGASFPPDASNDRSELPT